MAVAVQQRNRFNGFDHAGKPLNGFSLGSGEVTGLQAGVHENS